MRKWTNPRGVLNANAVLHAALTVLLMNLEVLSRLIDSGSSLVSFIYRPAVSHYNWNTYRSPRNAEPASLGAINVPVTVRFWPSANGTAAQKS